MKRLMISALMLLTCMALFAQQQSIKTKADWNPEIYSEGKLYPGFVIKLEGDTVKGYIKAKARCSTFGLGSSNQTAVEFYLNESDRKPSAKFKASELKGYVIADKEYESIKFSGGLFNKPNFNIVVKNGAIRLYEWYSPSDNFSRMIQQSGESWYDYDARLYDTKLVIAKNPNEPVEFGMLGLFFSKKFLPMIEDYPELALKVKNKEKGYTVLNLFDIIDEYNSWAAKK